MTNHIIIDGHNFIFQTGGDHKSGHRDDLLFRLAEYKRGRNIDITVVFDNKSQQIVGCERSVYRGIKVIYSPCGAEADAIINELVEKDPNKRRVTVVTTDQAHIGGYCKRLGSKVIVPRELSAMMEKARGGGTAMKKDSDGSDKPESATRSEIEYYLKKFQKGVPDES